MLTVPYNVRQDLVTYVPGSLLSEITSFVFHENRPGNKNLVDIAVCTLRGEVKEFYKKDIINSTTIDSFWKPRDIRILRNNKCNLFYLVSHEDEIAIVTSGDNLQVIHKIINIDMYEFDDFLCTGQATLKIIFKDDAVPLFFDNNFEKLRDRTETSNKGNSDDCLPIITQLSRKLTEVKYSVKCNEKVYKDLLNLRQLAAFSNVIKNCSLPCETVFLDNKMETGGPLKFKNLTPWVKMSNKKITIILEVENKEILLVENIHILLHSNNDSFVYTTKIFESISKPPYWVEKSNTIGDNKLTNIVAIVDLKEVQNSITSRVNLNGVVSYNIGTKEYVAAFEIVNLSSLEILGSDFDVLSTVQEHNDRHKILALLATSEKTELFLRHINTDNDSLNLLDEFCKHLNMEKISDNILLHKISPYHILHGVMVVEEKLVPEVDKWIISLHTRSQDQILAFIHYMHDAIPYRIIVTTLHQQMTSKTPQLTKYDDSKSECSQNINFSGLKSSSLKQTSMTLEYLDDCMIKMNESKNPRVQSKVGSEIDIFAGGVSRFQDFSKKMLEEAFQGIEACEITCDDDSEGMVVL